MILTRTSRRNIILFTAAFLLNGALHILLHGRDFAYGFSMLFCGVLTILWVLSVHKRVTDERLRALMSAIAACLLLHFILQILRYDLFDGNPAAQRYLWYGYYVPMLAQSLLGFFLAVFIYRPKGKTLPPAYALLAAADVLLMLGVLTNELHFSFKSFPGGMPDDGGQAANGWLFWLVCFYIYGLYALTYVVIVQKSARLVGRKYRWLPLIPFFIGYETIFSSSFIPAVILDDGGIPVYRTAAADYPFRESGESKLMSHAISGGRIQWMLDMQQVQELNRQIEDATQQIEARNAYLAEENRIRQERTELETRSRLYDSISRIVKPQLEQIDLLLEARRTASGSSSRGLRSSAPTSSGAATWNCWPPEAD